MRNKMRIDSAATGFPWLKLLFLLLVMLLGSIVLVSMRVTPVEFVRALAHEIRVYRTPAYRETPVAYRETDVEKLISIGTPADAAALRARTIAVVWGQPGLPSRLPARVLRGVSDERWSGKSLARIDELQVVMDFGLESRIYHFVPATPNNKVVLYHEGHAGDFHDSKPQIQRLLDEGYSVLGFSMPLLGLNNQPTVDLPRLGRVRLMEHGQLQFLSPAHGHPVQYFLEPVIVALNYLEKNFAYSSVSMMGISGGGWTTTLAAAVDTRIQNSFPVAGSLPIYLRSGVPNDWGDFEQTAAEIYRTTNYLDMYVLGAQGDGRRQLQVLNQFDPCCFAGTKSQTYSDIVSRRVQALGSGSYDLYLDDTHKKHAISEAALDRIIGVIEGKPFPVR